ncbi:MAG: HAMP domain-containing sensor histidine kinase [Halothece sp. Uz-M2-17]|nr:HAMP domain-containing sensor histidine kinase [Halothece sp. Uz-M2-17]
MYYRVVQNQARSFDRQLYKTGKSIAIQAHDELKHGTWRFHHRDDSLRDREILYLRWYNSQKQLVGFVGSTPPQHLQVQPGLKTIHLDNSPRETFRQLTLSVEYQQSFQGYLQIATSLQPLQDNLARIRLFLALGVPITLGLIGLTGWFLAGLAMKPVRDSYEQLQRFTADASHELRAPLAAMLSNAQVALLPNTQSSNQQQQQRLENIVQIAKGMSVLISNLLFLARHEGQVALQDRETIDLVHLLHALVAEYMNTAQSKGLKFMVSLPPKPIYFQGNRELLQQALKNLLNNAFHYTASGHRVDLRLFARSRHIIIEIADNGIGIPAQDLPHIFERFYRVDTARSRSVSEGKSRQTGNFGLGLSIVQQIIQVHGGEIKVHSVEQQGTTFEIELPMKSKV